MLEFELYYENTPASILSNYNVSDILCSSANHRQAALLIMKQISLLPGMPEYINTSHTVIYNNSSNTDEMYRFITLYWFSTCCDITGSAAPWAEVSQLPCPGCGSLAHLLEAALGQPARLGLIKIFHGKSDNTADAGGGISSLAPSPYGHKSGELNKLGLSSAKPKPDSAQLDQAVWFAGFCTHPPGFLVHFILKNMNVI